MFSSLWTQCTRTAARRAGHAAQQARHFTTPNLQARLWQLGKLNHVAIAVPDLPGATAFYRNVLGADVSEAVPLPAHGVTTVFVNLGNTKLELLHPLGEKSPIEGFLAKNKQGGIHHVDDIGAAMKQVVAQGIRALSDKPKIGAHNKPIVFLHPKDCGGVLIELEQA
ncbi:Glyoxalase/Bleomycin resistance protein/Dihydroxybiphenyl dioxygenase [Thamnocephalis sphaerospora]|uniref:Methylmalonyl-CoA epimerase, mitochondrial n=1 Tax=Thamnocephalis sphaerospora TaxID=78915 RepID=A0A4P9XXF2_9FUNG|nr:Glyoxalase/Bleomycin resistance protein/Dihydroxybiphenyl dioxygenase [Thamnocephalis sphaerospora]|eukprot:RKP10994.1 Glyoxalase/Bleomycin resistance protein/Dihydroxybiphenyl dioxygenase [Thamnocephalis sphaerospora]